MKKILSVILALVILNVVNAQVENPVKWSFSSKKINATTYEIHLTATIENDWHIYSESTPSGGPLPTVVKFSKNPLVTLNGNIKEVGKLQKHHEPLFGVEVKQYSDKVDFVQIVKLKGKVKTSLTGTVEFMACNDEKCLPPKIIQFAISIT